MKGLRKDQLNRINQIVNSARKNTEFYKSFYSNFESESFILKSLDDIRKLPILKKETLRKAVQDKSILSKTFSLNSLYHTTTTGSTGQPLELYFDRDCLKARSKVLDRIANFTRSVSFHRTVYVWREKSLSLSQKFLKKAGLFLAVNVGDFNNPVATASSKEALDHIVSKIRSFDPEVIRGYVSALYVLAARIKEGRMAFPSLKSVVASAEYLPENVWQEFEEVFKCPVYNLYGGSEAPGIAVSERDSHRLVISEDLYFIEVLNENGDPVKPGEIGLITITDLSLKSMPLIRYQIGDVAIVDESFYNLTDVFRHFISVEGRTNDIFELEDGSVIFSHLWHIVFRDESWIDKFKVVQETVKTIRIFILPVKMDQQKFISLQAKVEKMYAGIQFFWEIVDNLELDKGGKFRSVMSLVNNKFNKINK